MRTDRFLKSPLSGNTQNQKIGKPKFNNIKIFGRKKTKGGLNKKKTAKKCQRSPMTEQGVTLVLIIITLFRNSKF